MKKFLSFLLVGLLGITIGVAGVAAEKLDFKFEKTGDCAYDEEGMCTQTYTLKLENNTHTFTSLKFKVTPRVKGEATDKIKVGEFKPAAGWTLLSNDPLNVELFYSDNTEGVSDKTITFGTLTITKPVDLVDCDILFEPEGYEVVEKEIVSEKQPSTGVALPIIVLTCGLGVAFATYYVTKKNNKMYKI